MVSKRKVCNPKADIKHPKMAENEYLVEKVIAKRIKKGQMFYLIKWAGYSAQFNSWEPKENIRLLKSEEEEEVESEIAQQPCDVSIRIKQSNIGKLEEENLTTMDEKLRVCQGVKVESLHSATNQCGELMVLAKYVDGKCELIPTRILHTREPLMLLNFYEQHIHLG